MANETWDDDEEEIYRQWRVELLPRKQPRNPLQRLTRYLAERHPYLGWIGYAALGMTLGATAFRPGYGYFFYPLAGFLVLWLISHREIVLDFCYSFRSFEAYADRHLAQLRKAIVEDLVTLGHPREEAESRADSHIAELRSVALSRRQGK